jgi:hypothetical protein
VEERRHAEDQSRRHGDAECEREHAPVERDLERARNADRVAGEERAEAGVAERGAECAADERKQHTFGQKLTQQPEAAGAEGRTDRELFLPRLGPRQNQVREVGAGDQQNEADRALQHPQRRADGADDITLQRLRLDHVSGRGSPVRHVEVGPSRLLPFVDQPIDVGLCRLRRHAGLQASDQEQEVAAAAGRERFRIDRQRQEHFDPLVVDVVAGRHDADDARRGAVDRNDGADSRVGAAKVALPRRVRNDGDVFRAWPRIVPGEMPATQRRHADGGHQFGRHQHRGHAPRALGRTEIRGGDAIPADILKGAGPLLELGPFRQRHPEPVEVQFRERARDELELLGMRIRQWLEQDAVDDAENRGIRADAERQRQDGQRGIARASGKRPECVQHIVPESLHGHRYIN